MPNHIEQELGLGPIMHRLRRWVLAKTQPEDKIALDPLTVNYAAWAAMRRNVRLWPHYEEAPNSMEILVSPEDWEEYWGIDAARKEEAVASYVRSRAADRGYWIAGVPQVIVLPDDAIDIGKVEVVCQFVEPEEDAEPHPADGTAAHEPLPAGARMEWDGRPHGDGVRSQGPYGEDGDADAGMGAGEPPTVRFLDAESAGTVCLVGEGAFRLELRSGDCIGAVRPGEDVPPEVNVRLDAEGFPYADAKQCTVGVVDGRWTVTNHSSHGTLLVTRDGRRLMLGEPVPHPVEEGDVLCLGTERRLRFELGVAE